MLHQNQHSTLWNGNKEVYEKEIKILFPNSKWCSQTVIKNGYTANQNNDEGNMIKLFEDNHSFHGLNSKFRVWFDENEPGSMEANRFGISSHEFQYQFFELESVNEASN